jgi:hypothetical protein
MMEKMCYKFFRDPLVSDNIHIGCKSDKSRHGSDMSRELIWQQVVICTVTLDTAVRVK